MRRYNNRNAVIIPRNLFWLKVVFHFDGQKIILPVQKILFCLVFLIFSPKIPALFILNACFLSIFQYICRESTTEKYRQGCHFPAAAGQAEMAISGRCQTGRNSNPGPRPGRRLCPRRRLTGELLPYMMIAGLKARQAHGWLIRGIILTLRPAKTESDLQSRQK